MFYRSFFSDNRVPHPLVLERRERRRGI